MKSIEKFKFLNRNMNIDVFNVVFKTILTINAMKLMENEDVEPFSHFDVVFKTILTDNAEDDINDISDINDGRKTSFDKPGGGGAP